MTDPRETTAADIVHPTKQHFVYAKLRAEILNCVLKPGTRLRIDELAIRFGVSIIPVREALRMLQSEGLVVNVPHVGAAVSPLEVSAIIESLAIMEGLEIVSTRAVGESASAEDLASLDAQVAAMDAALTKDRAQDWAQLNRQFHLEIARMAGMPLLQDMLARAFDRWERVWHYYFEGVATRRIAQAQAEHREMIRQMKARDLVALEETIRRHNRAPLAAYLAQYEAAVPGQPGTGDR
jgi:DNA-binding GntR family transcriptional regulator